MFILEGFYRSLHFVLRRSSKFPAKGTSQLVYLNTRLNLQVDNLLQGSDQSIYQPQMMGLLSTDVL